MDADDLIALFGKITTSDHDTLVQQFSSILGTDPGVALFFLEASSWNVQVAVHNFLAAEEENGASALKGSLLSKPKSIPEVTLLSDLSQLQSMVFPPTTRLPMIWKFANSGTEPWPSDTQIVFVDGARMDGPLSISNVQAGPGEQVAIECRLTTPSKSGTYAGTWRFVCGAGYFGDPLWIIVVVDDASEEITQRLLNLAAVDSSQNQQQHQLQLQQQQQQQQQPWFLESQQLQAQQQQQQQHQQQFQQVQQQQQLPFRSPTFAVPSVLVNGQQNSNTFMGSSPGKKPGDDSMDDV